MRQEDLQWVAETWEKINQKMNVNVEQVQVLFPYTLDQDGKFREKMGGGRGLCWWTNGYWAGMLWIMYRNTGDARYKAAAERVEAELDKAFDLFDDLHHDVGFMWLQTAVSNYNLTGNPRSKSRGMHAAALLASRYNIRGEFIRAWNSWNDGRDMSGWAIIDCMMNIPILYWASRQMDDDRFRYIAQKHADKVIGNFVRPDGSVHHIVRFDTQDGRFIEAFAGQGYAVGSSWTRGQAWAIYGFALSYAATKEQRYLETSRNAADYFLANLKDSMVPPCDFNSPKEPLYVDTSAGAIAAAGMVELAKYLPAAEKEKYISGALGILRETAEKYCDWTQKTQAMVHMGTEAYSNGQNIPIIYSDYYFMEALDSLRGNEILYNIK